MYLESLNRVAFLAWDANANLSAFANPLPLTDAPSPGTGWRLVSNYAFNPGVVPSRMRVTPIGVGSNNDAFSMRIWALYKYLDASSTAFYWPQPILEISATLGAYTGIAGGVFTTTTRFADTITIVKEPVVTADVTNQGTTTVFSPANDTVAWVEFETRAAIGWYFDFDQTGGTTPTMNALIELIN